MRPLSDSAAAPQPRQDQWQQTPGGRILIGTLLSVGLCYGLLQLAIAISRAFRQGEAAATVSPVVGLVLFQVIQAIALIVGGIITGIGQRRAVTFGALVGLLSGLTVLAGLFHGLFASMARSFDTELLTPGTAIRNVTLYALPVLHLAFGGLGGWIGGIIWKPMPSFAFPAGASGGPLSGLQARIIRRAETKPIHSYWDGPIAWLRVILGTAIAVTGAIYARSIIDFLLLLSEGKLKIMTLLEDQVTFAEIFSLAILLGGCVAGANTRNGLKQGMCVGLGAAMILDALFLTGMLNPSGPRLFPVLSTLFLGPVGGWFASELLPPIYRVRRRRGWI
jgi:hypothetical protein